MRNPAGASLGTGRTFEGSLGSHAQCSMSQRVQVPKLSWYKVPKTMIGIVLGT